MFRWTRAILAILVLSSLSSTAAEPEKRTAVPTGGAAETSSDPPAEPADGARDLSITLKNRSIDGLETATTASGALRVNLQRRFQHALVLRIAPDGSRAIECVDSAERVAELLGIEAQASRDPDQEPEED